ncbi:hypothetical protein QQS21_007551 [Conoideocrella luteorostrata]|uniref:Uncharacterized protein n=1 Tax=Conoideocrella luteorostrata TaxID=1105319 RepID=A0AAJ0CMX7_9HYPO|nr:hypothetical protein QQS21_007551 [Conoideocrella luteorostrata]
MQPVDDDDMKPPGDSWTTTSSRETKSDPSSSSTSPSRLRSSTTSEPRTHHASKTPAIPIPGAVPPLPSRPQLSPTVPQINQTRRSLEYPTTVSSATHSSKIDHLPTLSQTFPPNDGFKRHHALRKPAPVASRPLSPSFIQEQSNASHHMAPLPLRHGTSQIGTPPSGHVPSNFIPLGPLMGLPPDDEFEGGSAVQPEDRVEGSITSENDSWEDLFAYRNAREFPPRLPAHDRGHLSNQPSRSSATNRITKWVTQYEKSHSPARMRPQDTSGSVTPERSTPKTIKWQSGTGSSHAEVEQLWQQLKEGRGRLHDIRQKMARIRGDLRSLRRRKDESEDSFITVIRPLLIGQRSDVFQSSLKKLDSRMAHMLALRRDYHAREETYESLELELDEEERWLSGLETRFFSLLSAGKDPERGLVSIPTGKNTTGVTSVLETPYELLGISADKPVEDIHPLYTEFSTAVGDLENAKEEHRELMFVHSQYEDQRALRESIGQGITADADFFFAEFSSEEERMNASITELDKEVQRLKHLCQEKRVMKKHLSVQMAYVLDPGIPYEDLELEDPAVILKRHHSIGNPLYSELLSQPYHLLASPELMTAQQALRAATRLPPNDPNKNEKQRLAAKECTIEALIYGNEPDNQAHQVNRWLLHQLRLSTFHVMLLQSVFCSHRGLKIRDYWRWQSDVMYYWWRDNTMVQKGDENIVFTTDWSTTLGGRQSFSQPSRAVSEGSLRLKRKTVRHFNSSELLKSNFP